MNRQRSSVARLSCRAPAFNHRLSRFVGDIDVSLSRDAPFRKQAISCISGAGAEMENGGEFSEIFAEVYMSRHNAIVTLSHFAVALAPIT